MNDNTFQEGVPVREPTQESWGPLPGLDPVEEYRALAHDLQECFPDATPQHLDRLIAREMRRYGGHSVAVITHAMLAASLYLAGDDEGDTHGYVHRTVYEAMQLKPTDDPALGWGV